MNEFAVYEEFLSSPRTEALFIGLTLLFFGLWLRRILAAGLDAIAIALLAFFCFFLFYSFNYRTLRIQLTPGHLQLRFGAFRWTIAMENIAACCRDEISLWRIGGAGIHFSPINGRYRAMFNFLEYPRVVVSLKRKQGPVRDIAFSTHDPDQVMRFIQAAGIPTALEERICNEPI